MIEILNGELYQWDTGREVKVDNVNVCEVHFASCNSDCAFVTVPVDGIAPIPNELLQSANNFVIYAVCESDTCEQTVEQLRVFVKERAKPDDYVYTETEVFSYKKLETRVKTLEQSSGVADLNYDALVNKPMINGVELNGNLSTEDLGIDVSDGTSIIDITVNGTSIVDKDGIASIPVASDNNLGVMKVNRNGGVAVVNDTLTLVRSTNNSIDARNSSLSPIVPSNLDYAVKQAMCDGKGAEWTTEEKAMARNRMGIGEWRYIGKVETQEDVARMDIALDENGQPFNLRKVKVKIVNYPNASDLNTSIRLCFNNKTQDLFHNSQMMTGVKSTETMRICEVVVEKIGNYLFPISMYNSINSTNVATILTTNVQYAYQSDCNEIDDYINKVYIYTWTNAIGTGAYMEVWGVDA